MKSKSLNAISLASLAVSTTLLTGGISFYSNKVRNNVSNNVSSLLDSSSDEEMPFP
jgi:outer membrane murein-binding lipoprotein Lpp